MLSGLSALNVDITDEPAEGLATQCVAHLTGLRDLALSNYSAAEDAGLLLQLTQLRQLTRLRCWTGAHLLSGHLLQGKASAHNVFFTPSL
jgi:hypothetical protein